MTHTGLQRFYASSVAQMYRLITIVANRSSILSKHRHSSGKAIDTI